MLRNKRLTDDGQKPSNNGEAIFSAHYFVPNGLLSIIAMFTVPIIILSGGAYFAASGGEYLGAGLLLFLVSAILLVSAESIQSGKLIF